MKNDKNESIKPLQHFMKQGYLIDHDRTIIITTNQISNLATRNIHTIK